MCIYVCVCLSVCVCVLGLDFVTSEQHIQLTSVIPLIVANHQTQQQKETQKHWLVLLHTGIAS